ncbi:hypothetical protein GIB67_004153 [Kingdonia uniflora]|uniref:Peptidase A1 domain-containing protein n=1 Tax=Kingdonia uniflora TaxID=39325 RepID=A0A7J7NRC9_9MAGN|nr:hypothetical protein GIB67_004153 [Kingdonia uniflora]
MASFNLLILFFAFMFISGSNAIISHTSFDPLLLPVIKDSATLQYMIHINQGSPRISVKLVVDLGGPFLWVECDLINHASFSYRPVQSRSIQCAAATSYDSPQSKKLGCNQSSCGLVLENPITGTITEGQLVEDTVELDSAVVVDRFLFSCAPTLLLKGLANGVKGIAGLGRRSRIALPFQLGSSHKFAICLSSSTTSNGVILFGDVPFSFHPNIDVSKLLVYTQLVVDSSDEYFIGVKSVKIDGRQLSIKINGGTKLSTVIPYTTLETSVYKTFTRAFITAAINGYNMTRVASVAPFETCFSSKNLSRTQIGIAVPTIDLVLQSEMVNWRIYAQNSMIRVGDDVVCLGFLNGGSKQRTSIVLGGGQLEDNLLEFDIATSRFGFSSSLLIRQTMCSRFKYPFMSRGIS